ncbi:VCBS repeat-containing protein [Streptomyces sp. NPDC001941]|uniref:FG-GAP repeat domain-containing protein n=1 Tax=Streptomyces sp. NPDC001941 TaxID=3154659 RepID=UPI0033277868
MRVRDFIGLALVPTLALGGVGIGLTTAAQAAQTSPAPQAAPRAWGAPEALTSDERNSSIRGRLTTKDGTSVLVWSTDEAGEQQTLWAATRAVDATAWSSPVAVHRALSKIEDVDLVAGGDGSVSVAFKHIAPFNPGILYSVSTLPAGGTAWSAATRISKIASPDALALASGSGGRLFAVWSSQGGSSTTVQKGLYVAEFAPGYPWTDPVRISDVAPKTLIADVASEGTSVIWQEDTPTGGGKLQMLHRVLGETRWEEPVTLATSTYPVHDLALQRSGAALLTWSEGSSGYYQRRYAVRPGSNPRFDAAATFPGASGPGVAYAEAVLSPDGTVTSLWGAPGGGVQSATRSAAGTWSATTTLPGGGIDGPLWKPGVAPDGSLNVLYVDATNWLRSATRKNGAWEDSVTVGQVPADVRARGGYTLPGADGRAVAVWEQGVTLQWPQGLAGLQIWTAATGAPKPPSVPSKRRDYVGDDGYPDLYARTAAGALTVYQGTAAGTVSAKAEGGDWSLYAAVVPFGDLAGDGANDTLAVTYGGDLYRVTPERGKVATPTSAKAKIGTGWGTFDGLTYSGDFTNDGVPDLVARQSLTGDLYLWPGTRAGAFGKGARIGTSWKGLTIVGAGDLNGDKHADLVARTANGDLYRYYGTGKGTVSSGVKIGSGWNGMADFVGIGDLTGDGRDDVLGRTKTGDLYRYAGNGTGGIGSGVKIGSGWSGFSSVS